MPTKKPHIHLATDHAGFEMKESVKSWLLSEGFKVTDHGADNIDPLDDFPDYIAKAARAVAKSPSHNKGLIFGGSGQGEAMMANRFKKIRATVYYGGNEQIIVVSREHNNANVLSLGARFMTHNHAKKVIWSWLHGKASTAKKYTRRNKKLDTLSKDQV